jgi:hypothetical protein
VVVGGKVENDGLHALAMNAVGSPDIKDHGSLVFQDLFFEVAVGDMHREVFLFDYLGDDVFDDAHG